MKLISTYSSCQWASNKTKEETAQPVIDKWEAKCDCAYAMAYRLLQVHCKESLQGAQMEQISIWEIAAICYFPFLTTGFCPWERKGRQKEIQFCLKMDCERRFPARNKINQVQFKTDK